MEKKLRWKIKDKKLLLVGMMLFVIYNERNENLFEKQLSDVVIDELNMTNKIVGACMFYFRYKSENLICNSI